MAFPPSAETIVALAFWTGTLALVLTGAALLWLLFLRLCLLVRQKQRQRTLHRWRPLLMSSLYQPPEALPRLTRLELPHVLELWNHLHDSLGDEARRSLERLAGQARIPAVVSAMLRNKDFYRRHLAARTAGKLRLASTWDGLRELLASDSPALSLVAARALVQIDAARAVPLLMPQLTGCGGWHPGAVREILHLAGAGHVVKPLLQAVATVSADKLPQLIQFLAEIAPGEAAPLISRFLATPVDDEKLLNACLDVLNSPGELEVVRALARHANWHVRVHAAKALGRLATREDEALLVDMLGDSQWWVRYRAAQALAQLPGMNFAELLQIKDTRTDRDARDMLHQVMAERELRENLTVPQHG